MVSVTCVRTIILLFTVTNHAPKHTHTYIIITMRPWNHPLFIIVHIGVGFDPVVYNISEGEMAMLRVILNTTIDQTITVFLQTQDGSAIGKLYMICLSNALYLQLTTCHTPYLIAAVSTLSYSQI